MTLILFANSSQNLGSKVETVSSEYPDCLPHLYPLINSWHLSVQLSSLKIPLFMINWSQLLTGTIKMKVQFCDNRSKTNWLWSIPTNQPRLGDLSKLFRHHLKRQETRADAGVWSLWFVDAGTTGVKTRYNWGNWSQKIMKLLIVMLCITNKMSPSLLWGYENRMPVDLVQ